MRLSLDPDWIRWVRVRNLRLYAAFSQFPTCKSGGMISKNTGYVLTYDEVIEVFVSMGKVHGAVHEPFTAATVAFQDGDHLQ